MSSQTQHEEEPHATAVDYHVMLTGFEPFGQPRPETNPSWELLRPLKHQILVINDGKTRVHLHCRELPVAYHAVRKLVPALHHELPAGAASTQRGYALYIHVGQGRSGAVAIEQLARYGPYMRKDNDGYIPRYPYCGHKQLAPTNLTGAQAERYCHAYFTSIDVDALAHWLNEQRQWQYLRTSTDAGLYLCEYTYYYSLRESYLQAQYQRMSKTPAAPTIVAASSSAAQTESAHSREEPCVQQSDEEETDENWVMLDSALHPSTIGNNDSTDVQPEASIQQSRQGQPVLFVHVPPVGQPYELAQLTQIITDIVTWVVTHYV